MYIGTIDGFRLEFLAFGPEIICEPLVLPLYVISKVHEENFLEYGLVFLII